MYSIAVFMLFVVVSFCCVGNFTQQIYSCRTHSVIDMKNTQKYNFCCFMR